MSPRLTVSERLRGRLRDLLKPRGTATRLASYGGPSQQAISYFMNAQPGRDPIGLDDLDAIADFFRVDIGSLLGVTRMSELSGDEQHLIYGFRVLAPHTQDAFLIVIDQASAGHSSSSQKMLHRRAGLAQNAAPPNAPQVLHAGDQVPSVAPTAGPPLTLSRFVEDLTGIMQEIGRLIAAAHVVPGGHPGAGTGDAPRTGTETG
jgi:hypothetical protein